MEELGGCIMSQYYQVETDDIDSYYYEAKELLIQEHLDDCPEEPDWEPTDHEIYDKCYEMWCDRAESLADYLNDLAKEERI